MNMRSMGSCEVERMPMSEQGTHAVIRRLRAVASALPWRILACLAAFLAAVALTYGWDALTGATGSAPIVPFAVRGALSAVLIFLGAFVVSERWLPPVGGTPSIPTKEAPAFVVAPAARDEREDGQDNGADLLPPHIPVRASDLPRILFDTNEMPAVTAPTPPPQENRTTPPVRAIHPPIAWPQHKEESQE